MSKWHVIDHEGCYIGTPNGVLAIASLAPEDAHAIVNAHNEDVAPTVCEMANYCQGFCRSCGTTCEEYIVEARRLRAEVDQLRADRDDWMQLAGVAELEVARMTAALIAIADKGEASPGDKKARKARDALTCHAPKKRV